MAEYKNRTTRKNESNTENDNKKKIMIMILIIIMILSLIASCSCSSNIFGRIGNLFTNSGTHDIDDNNDDNQPIINKDLKFNIDNLEIKETDIKTKIGFRYENINPSEFNCTTSNADIATCYVEDDYIILNPYKEGEVTVTLEATANGKTYKATTKVTIKGTDKHIALSSNSGTINMYYGKIRTFTYSLEGMSGNVTVISSDDSIATATAKDGVVTIKAKKVGKVIITVKIEYNGKTFTEEYSLTVVNNKTDSSGNNSTSTGKKKDKNSSLSSLTTNKGTLTPEFSSKTLEYYIGVSWWTWSIKLDATASNSNVQKNITYSYKKADKEKFEKIKGIDNLSLATGDNILYITVKAENGSKTTYKVTINRGINNYLDNITTNVGTLKPNFDKQKLEYTVEVPYKTDKITLTAKSENKNSKISATIDGMPTDLVDMKLDTPGTHTVKINVTHHNSTRTYIVKIVKASESGITDTSTNLSSLIVTNHDIDFTPSTTKYPVGLTYNESSVNITPTAESPNAKIYYSYNNEIEKQIDSGETISISDIEPGKDNKLVIRVENGNDSKSYEVLINRATNPYDEGGSILLKSLTAKGLRPEFKPTETQYYIDLDYKDSSVLINAIAENKDATVEYCINDSCTNNGNITNIPAGVTTQVIVKVTNELGKYMPYTINIYRSNNQGGGEDPKPPVESNEAELLAFTINGNDALKMEEIHIMASKNKENQNNNILNTVITPSAGASVKYYVRKTGDSKYTEFTNKQDFDNKLKGLNEGSYDIKIEVTSENKKNTKSYETVLVLDGKINSNGTLEPSEEISEEAKKTLNNLKNASIEGFDFSETTVMGEFYSVNNSPDNKKVQEIFDIVTSNNVNYLLMVNDKIDNIEINSSLQDFQKELAPGWNTLTIMYNESTSTQSRKAKARATVVKINYIYVIHIYIPNRTIKLESSKSANTSEDNKPITINCTVGDTDCTVEYSIIEHNYANLVNALRGILTHTTIDVKSNDSLYRNINFSDVDGLKINKTIANAATVNFIPEKSGEYIVSISTSANLNIDTKDMYIKVIVEDEPLKLETVGKDFTVDMRGENKLGSITLSTDYFDKHPLDTNISGKITKLCSADNANCIEVSIPDESKSIIDEIYFDIDKIGTNPTSININVKGLSEGKAEINVKGTYGEVVKEFKVPVTVRSLRKITLNAGDGKFSDDKDGSPVKTYTYWIGIDETLYFKDFALPFQKASECSYHKFVGYTTDSNSDTYNDSIKLNNNNTVTLDGKGTANLSNNEIVLYAKYDSTSSGLLESDIKNSITLKDVKLFGDYSGSTGKALFPGAHGYYEAELVNKFSEPIYITGIKIEETENICIDDNRNQCLNMGYIVKADDPEDPSDTIYYVIDESVENTTEDYKDTSYLVLNKQPKLSPSNRPTIERNFTEMTGTRKILNADTGVEEQLGKSIKIEPNSSSKISILWKWVELSNTLDTAIGQAANKIDDTAYSVNVSIEYTIYSKTCIAPNNR